MSRSADRLGSWKSGSIVARRASSRARRSTALRCSFRRSSRSLACFRATRRAVSSSSGDGDRTLPYQNDAVRPRSNPSRRAARAMAWATFSPGTAGDAADRTSRVISITAAVTTIPFAFFDTSNGLRPMFVLTTNTAGALPKAGFRRRNGTCLAAWSDASRNAGSECDVRRRLDVSRRYRCSGGGRGGSCTTGRGRCRSRCAWQQAGRQAPLSRTSQRRGRSQRRDSEIHSEEWPDPTQHEPGHHQRVAPDNGRGTNLVQVSTG